MSYYLSDAAVKWAIRELKVTTHPFLGITFLACKKHSLPAGRTVDVRLDAVTREHLLAHHRLDPDSEEFFQPFRSPKYWVRNNYASTGLQAVNTQTFANVFMHVRGRSEWGFVDSYVDTIASTIESLRHYRRVPLVAIAIWILKDHPWSSIPTLSDLTDDFLHRYHITESEQRLLFSKGVRDISSPLAVTEEPDKSTIAYSFAIPDDVDAPEGTLTGLRTEGVGPANALELELGDRLTVIAGDNGLGKSFLLDVAWWAVAEFWPPNRSARPFADPRETRPSAIIRRWLTHESGSHQCVSRYDAESEWWAPESEYPQAPTLGLYAQVDGSFSVLSEGTRANLSSHAVWRGRGRKFEGLNRDWVRWQIAGEEAFELLAEVTRRLSPSDLGVLEPATPKRLLGEAGPTPVIRHPYGDVPIQYVSAGVRRVLSLAYMLVWLWNEHRWEVEMRGLDVVRSMFVVIDEVECHLHPFWQRTILPAILDLGELLSDDIDVRVFVSTHSPLVLASIESSFNEDMDKLYHLALTNDEVTLEGRDFYKHGDASSWLVGEAFGLRTARSREAEAAIENAKQIQVSEAPRPSDVEEATRQLLRTLGSDDRFWRRWTFFARKHGVKL